MKTKNPVLGIILDGFGVRDESDGNPFFFAKMPNYKKILVDFPNIRINASGKYVGLPDGQMGNSEVGHINLGAGRVVYQDYMRITNAINDGTLQQNKTLVQMFERVKQKGSTLHFIGLVSNGGVHSDVAHLLNLLDIVAQNGIKRVLVHCVTDGRDTGVQTGKGFAKQVEDKLTSLGLGHIVTVVGRFFAMDRESRWNRTKEAFDLFVYGNTKARFDTYEHAFDSAYSQNISDEYIKPCTVCNYVGMQDGDEVFFFNFRPDRMRQLTNAFCNSKFSGFDRGRMPKVTCTSMCCYDETQHNLPCLFEQEIVKNTLSSVVSSSGLKQLKVAETTKYAHVTYYLNGGVEKPYKGEDRILIESEFVDDFAKFPQMRAREIAKVLVDNIKTGVYDLIIVNFSNADMVGHRGDMHASIKALEVLDECLGKVVECAQNHGVTCVITADHGNIEDERTSNGRATTHTTNPVPFIITDKKMTLKNGDFGLDCFAPTVLDILDIKKPAEMTGDSVIKIK